MSRNFLAFEDRIFTAPRLRLWGIGLILAYALVLAWTFWSVTGSPLELPYAAYIEQYEYVPNLIFEPLRPLPNFRHEEIKKIFVDYASIFYNYGQGWDIFWYSSQKFFALLFIFLFPFPILLIAAAAVPVATVSYRPLRILVGLLTFCFLVLCTETYFHPHYAAPALPILVIVLTCSAMQVSQWRRHDRPIGMRVIQYASLALLLAVPMLVLKPLLRGNAEAEPSTIRNDYFPKFAAQRAAVQALIEQIPGRHLIVVHYSPDHIAHKEWVYNGADIDGSKVVWAHDMGASSNRALLNYFSDRKVWYLDADSDAQPVPYLLN